MVTRSGADDVQAMSSVDDSGHIVLPAKTPTVSGGPVLDRIKYFIELFCNNLGNHCGIVIESDAQRIESPGLILEKQSFSETVRGEG
jgi:hypothetical protein